SQALITGGDRHQVGAGGEVAVEVEQHGALLGGQLTSHHALAAQVVDVHRDGASTVAGVHFHPQLLAVVGVRPHAHVAHVGSEIAHACAHIAVHSYVAEAGGLSPTI